MVLVGTVTRLCECRPLGMPRRQLGDQNAGAARNETRRASSRPYRIPWLIFLYVPF
jgi:hypothetical protein